MIRAAKNVANSAVKLHLTGNTSDPVKKDEARFGAHAAQMWSFQESSTPAQQRNRQLTDSSALRAVPRSMDREYNRLLRNTASIKSCPMPVGISAGHLTYSRRLATRRHAIAHASDLYSRNTKPAP